MKVWIRRSDGAYASFDGQTKQQVVLLMRDLGLGYEFLEEQDYLEAVNALNQARNI